MFAEEWKFLPCHVLFARAEWATTDYSVFLIHPFVYDSLPSSTQSNSCSIRDSIVCYERQLLSKDLRKASSRFQGEYGKLPSVDLLCLVWEESCSSPAATWIREEGSDISRETLLPTTSAGPVPWFFLEILGKELKIFYMQRMYSGGSDNDWNAHGSTGANK